MGAEAVAAIGTAIVSVFTAVASLGYWLATRFAKQDRFFGKLIDEHAKEDRANFDDVRTRLMKLELTRHGWTQSGRERN